MLRVPYTSNRKDAKKMAMILKRATPDIWQKVFDHPCSVYWGGSKEEFNIFVARWIEFLDGCDGYTVE